MTIDAMGCQRSVATQIVNRSGDYVFGLKGNQGLLHEAVEDYFTVAQVAQFEGIEHGYRREVDKDHGRLDVRRYWIEDTSRLPRTEQWKNLRNIGMVERTFTDGGVTTVDKRYFISSIAANTKVFAVALRGHWGVENRSHWRLDVAFGEDNSRIRTGNAPTIMNMIRHIRLNLLESEDSKLSMKKKRLKAARNDDSHYKVLFGM